MSPFLFHLASLFLLIGFMRPPANIDAAESGFQAHIFIGEIFYWVTVIIKYLSNRE